MVKRYAPDADLVGREAVAYMNEDSSGKYIEYSPEAEAVIEAAKKVVALSASLTTERDWSSLKARNNLTETVKALEASHEP